MEQRPDPLISLLEESLEFVYLRGGTAVATTTTQWTAWPFTVVGQSVEGPMLITSEGEEPVLLPAGGGYILAEGTRYRSGPEDGILRPYHWAHVRIRVLGELDLFHFIQSPHGTGVEIGERIAAINQRLAETLVPSPEPVMARVAERRRLCADLFSLIVSVCQPRPGAIRTVAALTRLAPVFRFMREQMARPISRDELPKIAGLSRSQFHTVFLDATGQSPLQYLTGLRLKQAQELLISTQRPVSEIGEAVGFRDPFHFSRTFKRFSGVSPRAYRQRSEFLMA